MHFISATVFVPASTSVTKGDFRWHGTWGITGAQVHATINVVVFGCQSIEGFVPILKEAVSSSDSASAEGKNKKDSAEEYLMILSQYERRQPIPSGVLAKVQEVFGKGYSAFDVVYCV